jgi:CCR4-NOT transcription complex subunit 1
LFGKLIQHQLISHVPLGIAFRYVLEALRKPANSKMFKFGALALDQFKGRLHEWPQYCAFLAQIPHLRQLNPKLMEWVDRAKGSAEVSSGAEGVGVAPQHPQQGAAQSSAGGAAGNAALANLGDPAIVSVTTQTNVAAASTVPPVPVTALAVAGVEAAGAISPTKSRGPLGVSTASAIAATSAAAAATKPEKDAALRSSAPAAQGGASSSNTFSSLPLDLLLASAPPIQEPPERVKDRIHFIFNNVSVSNLSVKAKEMRELLLDEHQPYLARYFVVKRAAIEPNFQSLYVSFMDALVSVLPHLLDAVLVETFHNVRVLIDSEDIASSSSQRTILKNLGSWLGRLTIGKDRPLLHRDLCPKKLILSAFETGKLIVVVPFVAKILAAAADSRVFKPPNAWTMAQLRVLIELYNLPDLKLILKFETEVLCNHLNVDQSEIRPTQLFVNRPEPSGLSSAQITASASSEKAVHNLDSFVRIPAAASALFALFPQLQRFVPIAMDAAIREIIQPVVERSVTIACITTRELVSVDFASEGDETRLRQAARMMVRSLSGSLAGVTCAEPLRVSMSNHLRSLLQSNASASHKDQMQALEQTVSLVVQENLELACALIEKAATERAVVEVEEALAAGYAARISHAQGSHRGRPFSDPAVTESFPAVVPQMLRSSPNGLSTAEYRVYEDFTRLPMTFDRYRLLPEINPDALLPPSRAAVAAAPGAGQATSAQQQLEAGAAGVAEDALPRSVSSETLAPQAGQQIVSQQAPQPAPQHQQLQQPVIEAFKTVVQELDKIFVAFGDSPVNTLPQTEITNLVRQIPHLIVHSGESAPHYAVTFAQVLFTRLFENSSPIFQEIQLVCLKGIRDVSAPISKDITAWTMGLPEDRAHNYKAILGLIRFQLIQVAAYDSHLAKMLVNGTQKTLELAIYLIKNCCLEGRYAAAMAGEFARTIAVLRSVQGIEGKKKKTKKKNTKLMFNLFF